MADREIKVRINGDTSGLDRSLSRGQANLAKFAKVAGAAVLAAGAAMGSITLSTAAAARELSTFARLSNSTTTAFQRMAAGARTVGIENGKMADILKDVNDRIGDFVSTGGGPMADFFDNIAPKVGVTIDQFARLSGPEALQLYVSSLERAGVSQQEMTFYMEAMASDASALIPLLRDNGAEMQSLGDSAERLGAILDQDSIDALSRTSAAVERLKQIWAGTSNQIAILVGPALEKLADILVMGSEKVRGFGNSFRVIAGQVHVAALNMQKFFIEAIQRMAHAFSEFTWGVADGLNNLFGTDLTGWTGAISDGTTLTQRLAQDLIEVENRAASAKGALDVLMGRASGDTGEGDLRLGSGLLPPEPGEGGEGGGFGSGVPGLGGAEAVTNDMAERLAALVEGLMTEQETIAAWYEESRMTLDDALSQELLTREQYAEAVERLEEEHQRRLQSIREMGNKWGVQAALSGGAEILGAMGQMSEKALKASKIFAAAEALVSTYQGAAKELRNGTFGFASAAAVIAKGIGFVAAIKGVNASAGASVSGGGGSGGASAAASAGAQQQQQQQPGTTFQFTLQNDPMGFGESFARQMIEQLNRAQRDGGRIQAVLT